MRRILSGLAVIAALFASGCMTVGNAPGAAVPVAAEPGFSAQSLSDHIKILASDEFAGRFPGEVGEELTLDYLQAHYEALGLEPGGLNGQWRQPVDLVRFTPARAPTASWARGGVNHDLGVGTDIVLRARDDDGLVQVNGAPMVFAGYGIVAPERGWDDYGDADLTGKVVILLSDQPDAFGEYPNFYGSPEHKMVEALERGAIGVLTLVEGDVESQPWRGALARGSRATMAVAGAQGVEFTGWINKSALETIGAPSGGDILTMLAAAELGGNFRARVLDASLSVDIAEATRPIRSHNLLAKIPGTERPDEYLFYSAHWDHVGKAPAPNAEGDDIFNGAWDNASGTAGLMEIARAFMAGPRPERTVVFLHVTAEEQGLLGSEWYGAHPVYPLERSAADINIDMLPLTPATRTVAIFGPGKSTLEDDLADLAAVQGRTVTGEGEPEQGFYYRSDHFNFAIAGVPALMPWTGVDFVEGGEAVGRPYYMNQMSALYHGLDDEWRADIDYTAALENLQLLYRLGRRVADSEAWPQWKPGVEFVAVRAASEAARR